MSVVSLADAKAIKDSVRLEIVLPGDVIPGLRRWAREIESKMNVPRQMDDATAAAAAVSCFVDTIEQIATAKQKGLI